MIDIKALRDDPERFKNGVRLKRADVNIDELLAIDTRRRELTGAVEVKRAEQNKFSKEMGPELGRLKGQLKSASVSRQPFYPLLTRRAPILKGSRSAAMLHGM